MTKGFYMNDIDLKQASEPSVIDDQASFIFDAKRLNIEKLQAAIDYLKTNFPSYRSISVYQNETMVFENVNKKPYESIFSKVIRKSMSVLAFHSPNGTFIEEKSEKWNIRSATKSIISILIGIAIKEGFISSIEDNLGLFFCDHPSISSDDDKKSISIKHLLTMKSGLSSVDKGMEPIKLIKSKDWVDHILKRPLQSSPGTNFEYNSANTHILSAIITKTTGMNAAKFAKKYLFDPLGINQFIWDNDTKGNSFGGGNLFLKPYDMAKIGFLIIHNGNWKGKEIVPQNWISESLERSYYWDYGFHYGYLWYIKDETDEATGNKYVTYSAAGAGGQKLLIFPELNIVLVAYSHVDFIKDKSYFLNLMIPEFILPACLNVNVDI